MASKPGLNRTSSQANRLPAPSLFIGPPSRNASNTSIIPPTSTPGGGINPSSSRTPALARQRSHRGVSGTETPIDANPMSPTTSGPGRKDVLSFQLPASTNNAPTATASPAGETAQQQQQPSTDAIWAEMQNTLEEVELSAINGTHVFRPGHSSALDELRTAQIALAQAWARSEAEEEEQESEDGGAAAAAAKPLSTANVLAHDREQKLLAGGVGVGAGSAGGGSAGGARPRSGTEASAKSQLERDTENDIQLARKRREANDRYFQRVNAGVLDVVAKLEEVARAMKGVEQESKEIWGDGESVDTASFVSK
ncbi:hypothetical protein MPH_01287 [Macrophomina phaseolina MS6]|uniref:Uncharacterized protein n=1 Tax=Macrophomina phaseolina (strain MS6) TaxID=1126212 RepID=K2SXK6_MACPH|nr:hypothetical protein MPH_01287 [Macrophomina phaseolina MS6]